VLLLTLGAFRQRSGSEGQPVKQANRPIQTRGKGILTDVAIFSQAGITNNGFYGMCRPANAFGAGIGLLVSALAWSGLGVCAEGLPAGQNSLPPSFLFSAVGVFGPVSLTSMMALGPRDGYTWFMGRILKLANVFVKARQRRWVLVLTFISLFTGPRFGANPPGALGGSGDARLTSMLILCVFCMDGGVIALDPPPLMMKKSAAPRRGHIGCWWRRGEHSDYQITLWIGGISDQPATFKLTEKPSMAAGKCGVAPAIVGNWLVSNLFGWLACLRMQDGNF